MSDERNERPLSTADIFEAGERRESTRVEGDSREARPEEQRPVVLLPQENVDRFQSRWSSIQTRFVDDPRNSVEQADSLVAELLKEIAQMFATERQMLEKQWTSGDDVSTEDLRIALQRYRSFFNRLLSL
jgi:hypothetical protein